MNVYNIVSWRVRVTIAASIIGHPEYCIIRQRAGRPRNHGSIPSQIKSFTTSKQQGLYRVPLVYI